MDCYQIFDPLPGCIEGVHFDTATGLGSQQNNTNAIYGYMTHKKPRWTNRTREFVDLAALERHGIDPTKPVPAGVIVSADPYGYPIDGFTTGYTTKLPPPADPVVAINTPKSFNVPAVVQSSNGSGGDSGEPIDDQTGQLGTQPLLNPAGTLGNSYGSDATRGAATQASAITSNAAAATRTALQRATGRRTGRQ